MRDKMKIAEKIKAWYCFAKKAWIALAFGWLSVLFVPIAVIRLDQWGALLICGSIVADVFHDKRHRLFIHQILPGQSTSYTYRVIHKAGEAHPRIEVDAHTMRAGKTSVNTQDWVIYKLSANREFADYEGSKMWHFDATVKRLESRVEYSIVVSAVVGTILWAFF